MKIVKGRELYLRTLIYIFAVILFFSYWNILGPGTAFIGATIAKGSLVLLNADLTANPLRSTLVFFLVFIYIGFFSFLASLNLYCGLFINFFALFFLTYNLISNLKQAIWRPFILGYLYLLIEPGNLNQLPTRLFVLALGAPFMLLTQFILNKNKSNKNLQKELNNLVTEISLKLKYILNGENGSIDNEKVVHSVDKIVSTIYGKRIDPFFILGKDNIILNLSLYMERLNYLLKEITINLNNNNERIFISDLLILTDRISTIIEDKKPNTELLQLLNDFLDSHKSNISNDYYLYELIQNISMLKLSIENVTYNSYSKKEILLNRKLRANINNIFKFRLGKDSIRFTFAFRLAFLLSISYFIVELFHITKGKWIVFTIYAGIEPFIEDSNKRFPKRFKGTLLGIVIFLGTYLLIDNIYIKGLVFIVLYYIYVISKDFTIKTMCTASVGLGLFAIVTNDPAHGIVYRFIFVGIGIVVGYLGTRFIFPYDIKVSSNKLIKCYFNLSSEILEFAFNNDINDYFFKMLNEKLLISKLYETKLIINNNISEFHKINAFVYNQRILNNTIYFLFFSLKNNPNSKDIITTLKDSIDNINLEQSELKYNEDALLKKMKDIYLEKSFDLHNNEEKLAFINLERILLRVNYSKDLINSIIK